MTSEKINITGHFSSVSCGYARYRPDYPRQLAGMLAGLVPARRLALDVGCGTGQLSVLLAEYFDSVIASDASETQLSRARTHAKIRYLCQAAEKIGVKDGSVDLIVAAQAAHWFTLPAFYAEVQRVAAAGAYVALISYGVMRIDGDVDERFQVFYRDEIAPYWPPERFHVETGYAGFDFPFREQQAPAMMIHREWDLDTLLGYVRTWTAVHEALRQGKAECIERFEKDMTRLWGDPLLSRHVSWPIAMRLGQVNESVREVTPA